VPYIVLGEDNNMKSVPKGLFHNIGRTTHQSIFTGVFTAKLTKLKPHNRGFLRISPLLLVNFWGKIGKTEEF
jgi:hypothetical protein